MSSTDHVDPLFSHYLPDEQRTVNQAFCRHVQNMPQPLWSIHIQFPFWRPNSRTQYPRLTPNWRNTPTAFYPKGFAHLVFNSHASESYGSTVLIVPADTWYLIDNLKRNIQHRCLRFLNANPAFNIHEDIWSGIQPLRRIVAFYSSRIFLSNIKVRRLSSWVLQHSAFRRCKMHTKLPFRQWKRAYNRNESPFSSTTSPAYSKRESVSRYSRTKMSWLQWSFQLETWKELMNTNCSSEYTWKIAVNTSSALVFRARRLWNWNEFLCHLLQWQAVLRIYSIYWFQSRFNVRIKECEYTNGWPIF